MDNREQLQQQMLELIYGLLSDDQSAELVERISSDRELARAYAELKEQTELLAEAVKAPAEEPPDYAAWKRQADRPQPVRARTSHWASPVLQVVAALAACLLLVAVGFPFVAVDKAQETLALEQRQAEAADQHLAMSLTGPAVLAAQLPGTFLVSIENGAEQPVEAEVEYTFKADDGSTVYFGRALAVDGQAVCRIPPDEVASAATLDVVARHGQAESQLGLDLQSAPPKPVAVLQADRTLAEPGQSIQFRAVVLEDQTQRVQSAPLAFFWQDPVTNQWQRVEQAEPTTIDGVATGELTLPSGAEVGQNVLAVQTPLAAEGGDLLAIDILPPTESPSAPADEAALQSQLHALANSARFRRQMARSIPKAPGQAAQVAVVPEGGRLVAGVSNRLYFWNQTPQHELPPVQLLDDDAQLVRAFPPAASQFGWFDFVPEASQRYTLQVESASQEPVEQALAPVEQISATFQVVNGVAPANQPLQVEVHIAEANRVLALVAGDQQQAIGHHIWEVGVNAPITQVVELDLPEEASGAQRLRLYEVASHATGQASVSPKLLAERAIYRIPLQRLEIEVDNLPRQTAPGQALELKLQVSDEFHSPAQATLGVQMERVSSVLPPEQKPLGIEGEVLLRRLVELPPAAAIPDEIRTLEQDPHHFDQLLATSTWRAARQVLPGLQPPAEPREPRAETASLPLVRRSNKQSVRSQYEAALATLQNEWQERLQQVHKTSSWMLTIAGCVLGVCLLGLALVQGLPRIGLWGPGLLVALGSLLWGVVGLNLSLDLTRLAATSDRAQIARSETPPAESTVYFAEPSGRALPATEANSEGTARPIIKPPPEMVDEILREESSDVAMPPAQAPASPARQAPAEVEVEAFGFGGIGGGGVVESRGTPTARQPQTRRLTEDEPQPPRVLTGDAAAAAQPSAGAPVEDAPSLLNLPETDKAPEPLLPEPVLWLPRLATTSEGTAEVEITLPPQPGRYRLLIDAHGSGRLATIVRYIDVSADAAPPE